MYNVKPDAWHGQIRFVNKKVGQMNSLYVSQLRPQYPDT